MAIVDYFVEDCALIYPKKYQDKDVLMKRMSYEWN